MKNLIAKKKLIASFNDDASNLNTAFNWVSLLNNKFLTFNPRIKLTCYRNRWYITLTLTFHLIDDTVENSIELVKRELNDLGIHKIKELIEYKEV